MLKACHSTIGKSSLQSIFFVVNDCMRNMLDMHLLAVLGPMISPQADSLSMGFIKVTIQHYILEPSSWVTEAL